MYVSCMLQDISIEELVLQQFVIGQLWIHGSVHIDACLGELSLHEENPGIGVQVDDITRFAHHGTVTHLLGHVQLFSADGEVIGIVVQAGDIVLVIHQCRVISSKGLCHLFLMVIDVAQHGESFGYSPG